MAKLKFVNAATNEMAIINIASFKDSIFDVIKNEVKLFSNEKLSDEDSIKKFLIGNVSLQIVTKKVSFATIIKSNLTFEQINVTDSMKIGVFVHQSPSAKPPLHLKKTTASDEVKLRKEQSKPEQDVEKKFSRDLKAIAPNERLNITQNNSDSEDAEMGIEDFKNFYEVIANKAHNKKDASKDILAQKKLLLQECHVRIKFPDRTILQAKFTNMETSATLYNFVREQLNDPDLSFKLLFGHPLKVVKNSETLYLIKDLLFEKRTSLIFETSNKKLPFLKQNIKLESLENIKKGDQPRVPAASEEFTIKKEKTEEKDAKSKKQKLEDKMAKFLKLSKK